MHGDMHWGTILTVAGIVTPLILAGLIFTHRKLVRPLQMMASDWHGKTERRGAAGQLIAEAIPGVMEQLKGMDTRQNLLEKQVTVVRLDIAALRGDTAEVKGQLRPNGGDSFYDKVTGALERQSGEERR